MFKKIKYFKPKSTLLNYRKILSSLCSKHKCLHFWFIKEFPKYHNQTIYFLRVYCLLYKQIKISAHLKDVVPFSSFCSIALLYVTSYLKSIIKHKNLNGKDAHYVIHNRSYSDSFVVTWIRNFLHHGWCYSHSFGHCNYNDLG